MDAHQQVVVTQDDRSIGKSPLVQNNFVNISFILWKFLSSFRLKKSKLQNKQKQQISIKS
jgi:hypothetical protein